MNRIILKDDINEVFSRYRPPVEYLDKNVNGLVSLLIEILEKKYEPDMFLTQAVRSIIGLLVYKDRLTGISSIVVVDKNNSVPLLCLLAKCIAVENQATKSTNEFIDDLSNALLDPKVNLKYPNIFRSQTKNKIRKEKINLLSSLHYELANSEAYAELATDLQLGLIVLLTSNNWKDTAEDITAFMSSTRGLRRIFKEITHEESKELRKLLSLEINDYAAGLVKIISTRLKNSKKGATEFPLGFSTMGDYSNNFTDRVIEKTGISRDKGERDHRNVDGRDKTADYPDDDYPEETSPEDRKRLIKIEKLEIRARTADRSFTDQEQDFGNNDSRLYIPAEELSVMELYLDWLSWKSCLHINEVAGLIKGIYQLEQQSEKAQKIATVLMSMLFTGRTTNWLRDVRLARPEGIKDPDIRNYPVFDPVFGAIYYSPKTFADVAAPPHYRPGISVPMSEYWCLPLPNQLIPYWIQSSKGCQPGQSIFEFAEKQIQEALLGISLDLQERIPAMPAISEQRIRGAFSALFILEGGLDPVLAAIVSDQRSLVPNATLFYTTIPVTFLADQYRKCADSVFETIYKLFPAITHLQGLPVEALPNKIIIGSGYYPKIDSLRFILQKLANKIRETDDKLEAHNYKTVLFLYMLSLLCGLRISEVSHLRLDQFDEVTIKSGQKIRLLILPETRSSRYASAGRAIPIPIILQPLLEELLSEASNPAIAFFFHLRGKRIPVTKNVKKRMEKDLPGLEIPRWHAGRHLLRTYLLMNGMDYRAINAILGHTRQGEELFNPYLPGDIVSYWSTYLFHAEKLASVLGIEELL